MDEIGDSGALGPEEPGQNFIRSLKEAAGIKTEDEEHRPEVNYELELYVPGGGETCFFQGDAYLMTDLNPFEGDHDAIMCSLNGLKHELIRDRAFDQGDEVKAYKDKGGNSWLLIFRQDGRKYIYSPFCLVEPANMQELGTGRTDNLGAFVGTYRNRTDSDEHPSYHFTERDGVLFMSEGDEKAYPCLYVSEKRAFVSGKVGGRQIQFRFPEDPDTQCLEITDILNDLKEPPFESVRVSD